MANSENISKDHISLLEHRVDVLETLIFGGKPCNKVNINIIDSLTEIADKLRNCTARKELSTSLYNQIQELGPAIDAYNQSGVLCEPSIVRWQLISSQYDHLITRYQKLNQIIEKRKVLDSPVFSSIISLQPKLQEILQFANKQLEESKQIENEFYELVSEYDKYLHLIKIKFLTWEQILYKLENTQKKKWTSK